MAGHRMLTTTNWEQSLKLILFKLHEKFPKNSMSTILQSFSIWSKLEWWKNLVGGYLMSWLKIKKKKIIILKYCLLLFNAMTMNHFLIRLWYVTKKMDFIWQPAMTNWVVGLRRSSKALPKVKLAPKTKVMVTVWWFAASLIHYSFLNPRETITYEKYAQPINKMHQKLQCLQPALVNRKGPVLLHDDTWTQIAQPTFQTLNELGYEVLPLPSYSPDLLPTDYHFFQHLDNFLQRKCLYNQ